MTKCDYTCPTGPIAPGHLAGHLGDWLPDGETDAKEKESSRTPE